MYIHYDYQTLRTIRQPLLHNRQNKRHILQYRFVLYHINDAND